MSVSSVPCKKSIGVLSIRPSELSRRPSALPGEGGSLGEGGYLDSQSIRRFDSKKRWHGVSTKIPQVPRRRSWTSIRGRWIVGRRPDEPRSSERDSMSKFILLLHEGPNAFPPDISPDQIQAIIQRYVAWRQKVQQNGRKVEGHKLTDGEGRVMKGVGGIRQGHRRPIRRSPRSDRRPLHCRSAELRGSRRAEQGLPSPRFRHHRDSRGPAHVGRRGR